jgi:hypothetical protein
MGTRQSPSLTLERVRPPLERQRLRQDPRRYVFGG